MALQGSSIGTDDIFDQADKAIAIQYLMTEMEYHLIVFYGFERNIPLSSKSRACDSGSLINHLM